MRHLGKFRHKALRFYQAMSTYEQATYDDYKDTESPAVKYLEDLLVEAYNQGVNDQVESFNEALRELHRPQREIAERLMEKYEKKGFWTGIFG